MESSAEEYAAFEAKVRRTLYIDNLSPLVNESILKSAFGQFGNVVSVEFIPNYLEPNITHQSALVEMENPKQARGIISDISNSPFMISGMPRPVRALPAEPEMFDDRPRKPGRKIECRWVEPDDPEFEAAKKIMDLTRKHVAEAAFLAECEAEAEKKLADQQAEALKSNHKKYELIDNAVADKTTSRLGARYNMRVSDA